jgi:hypothetical protein
MHGRAIRLPARERLLVQRNRGRWPYLAELSYRGQPMRQYLGLCVASALGLAITVLDLVSGGYYGTLIGTWKPR